MAEEVVGPFVIIAPGEDESAVIVQQYNTHAEHGLVRLLKQDGTLLLELGPNGEISFGPQCNIAIPTKDGPPVDEDFYQPRNGIICMDNLNNRLYVRVGVVWKSVAVA